MARRAVFRRDTRPPRRRVWTVLGRHITLTPVPSGEQVGAPALLPGPVVLAPASVPSAEAVGAPTLLPGPAVVAPASVPSAEAVGAPTVEGGLVLAPASAPSAEAVGAPTLSAGAVTITPGSVASAETVGAASVILQLALVPVPTAAQVGAPTVAAGAVTLTVASVASTEATGSPTLLPGTITLSLTPVPSGETIGRPALRLHLLPVSVPTGETVGAPTLLPGLVTLTVTSILSGEQVGILALTVTVDPARLVRRAPIRVTVAYELLAVARVPQPSGSPLLIPVDPVEWSGLAIADELSRPQRLDAGAPIASLTDTFITRLREPAAQPTELWCYRDGQIVFAGPILTATAQGETLTLQAVGLLGYLTYWRVVADLVFAQVDQHLIAKGLVDHWQTAEYGHVGIDTAGITPSGKLRDATYLADEDHPIGQRVEELCRREGGFDVEVDPVSRMLRCWHPLQGVDRSEGPDAVVFDSRNIVDSTMSFSVAPGDVASDAYGVGTGTGDRVRAHRFDPEVRARFGRTAVAATFDGVSEQATIDAHTQGLLDARRDALFIPGPQVRVTPDADLSAFAVGDTVSYQLHERLGVSGAYRVRRRTVRVDESGVETCALEFA